MLDGPRGLAIMRIFAARARAELERLRTEDALRHANEALARSEERFRDLFDEAPIAYVHEGLDSRFIEANHTAMRILGLKRRRDRRNDREVFGARYCPRPSAA